MEHYLNVIRDCLEEGNQSKIHLRISQGRILPVYVVVLSGTDETDGGVPDTDQSACLPYNGLWREFPAL